MYNIFSRSRKVKKNVTQSLLHYINKSNIPNTEPVNMKLVMCNKLSITSDKLNAEDAFEFTLTEIGAQSIFKCIESTKYSMILEIDKNNTAVYPSNYDVRRIQIRSKIIPYRLKVLN